jgi:hypothetical protein
MCIYYTFVGLVVFAAMAGVALIVLAAVLRVWSARLSETESLGSVTDQPDELEKLLGRGYVDLSR